MYLDYPCRYMYLACIPHVSWILHLRYVPALRIHLRYVYPNNPICIFEDEVSRMYPSCILELHVLQIHLSRMYP